MYSVSKVVLTFHCVNKLFLWFGSAFSLKVEKFFLITWTIFLTIGKTISETKYQYAALKWQSRLLSPYLEIMINSSRYLWKTKDMRENKKPASFPTKVRSEEEVLETVAQNRPSLNSSSKFCILSIHNKDTKVPCSWAYSWSRC